MLYYIKRMLDQERLLKAMGRLKTQLLYFDQGGTVETIYPIITSTKLEICIVHCKQPYDSSLTYFEGFISVKHKYNAPPKPHRLLEYKLKEEDVCKILNYMIDKTRILRKNSVEKIYFQRIWDMLANGIEELIHSYTRNESFAYKIMTVVMNEYQILFGSQIETDPGIRLGEHYIDPTKLITNCLDAIMRIHGRHNHTDFGIDFKL